MKKYHLYLTADERRIILDSLIDKKNELIRTGHFSDAIDKIIIEVMKAKVKRVRVKEV
ncbi:hypothetical protein [uncultured Ruminococcus sp.]|uniref:hypothetical protein n=1 Tax=uncultured Ruminococcus sp. TaxID=165186 RepID=UPI0029305F07|nr:hypothetical protein [uncultured Ruminococcus sp.]